ncbi:MAG: DUF362 domain-containing protein [Planctomycetota bacterium]
MASSPPRPLVAFARCTAYEPAPVRAAAEALLDALGGLGTFVKRGDRVLLKPNLLAAHAPERAVTTHPAVVRAVAELVRDCGGRVLVGDSPGYGSFQRVARATGMEEAVRAVGGELVEFTLPEKSTRPGDLFQALDLAQELSTFDVHINLPKFKTHALAVLTLGVKNCFGTVVGPRKLQWHYRAGHNRGLFARMLVEVFRLAAPDLTLIDAVVGMEGQGPSSGRPRPLGFLAASADCLALEAACARVAGLEPLELPVLAAAQGKDSDAWLAPAYAGLPLEAVRAEDFALADGRPFHEMGPRFLVPLLRRLLVAEPVPARARCTGCGVCAEICPARAIALSERFPRIDRKTCIRCYCCHELCPEHAMGLSRPLPARLLERLGRKRPAR